MSSELKDISSGAVTAERGISPSRSAGRIRRIAATTTALTFMLQNIVWAACTDGSTFPTGGFIFGVAPANNSWAPNTLTGTLGSAWVPDTSVCEQNMVASLGPPATCLVDPSTGRPFSLTNGGHDWVFDQGTTTCKATDIGSDLVTGGPTSWTIPAVNGSDCVLLPVVRNGFFVGIGDVPQKNDVLTPTCDPTKLSQQGLPNPANTRLNQLGCSISRGVATTAATATTYLFVAGIKGGLFNIPLDNMGTTAVGADAGKIVGGLNYYSSNNVQNQKLDSAAISKDGQFLFGASSKNGPNVFACLNPLGDPGDPSQPINPSFSIPPSTSVLCMAIGNATNSRVEGLVAGSDGQPYMANNIDVTNFVDFPNCIFKNNGSTSLFDAFQHNRTNGCGNGVPNVVMNTVDGVAAGQFKAETQAFLSHGDYIYRATKGGLIEQFKLTVSLATGGTPITTVARRTYGSFPNPTGLGVSDGLNSLMVYDDPSGVGLAAQEVLTRVPVCEDM